MRLSRVSAVAAAVGLIASVAGAHEEDWRKLADRLPPVFGPIYTADDVREAGSTLELPPQAISGTGVSLLSWVPVNNFPGPSGEANDCWGYVSPSGREYALVGLECGMGVVEITDPINPVVIGVINGPCSPWRDVKTIGQYAYVVSEGGGGLQVVDLSLVDAGIINLAAQFTAGGYSTTHNVVADPVSNYIYLVGANIANGGLVAVDVSNPTNPQFAGQWSTRYVHDAQVVTYTSGPYAGRQIAYCYNGGAGLEIIDVTNKSNMFRVGGTSYGQIAYCHQGWIDPTGTYAYLNDELDEQTFGLGQTNSRIINVSNINAPFLVGSYSSGRTSIDHNNYWADGFIFQANYRSGLQVFDVSNPTNPVLVGSYDTFPSADGNNFNGAWSVYPYFPSRNIIVSDIESGLFVLQVDAFNPPALTINVDVTPGPTLEPQTPASVEAIVEPGAAQIQSGGVSLVYSVGEDPEVSIPMTALGNDRYAADLPGFDCFDIVDYRVVAVADTSEVIESPGFSSTVRTGEILAFEDNFATNLGWTTVTNGATGGQWQRGIPAGDGTRGDPVTDFDGDGFAYLTENGPGNTDVDGGPVVLTSPAIDLGADARPATLTYAYWIYSTGGETLFVEASANAGASWQPIAAHPGGTSPSWIENTVDLPPTSGTDLRVRFSVADNPNNDVTEAAVDAVRVNAADCEFGTLSCNADLTTEGTSNGEPDGIVSLSDFSFFLALWSSGDAQADITLEGVCAFGAGGDGVTLSDFSCYLAAWSAGCP